LYHFSRAIYLELAPLISDEKPPSQRESNHLLVLRACERAMERLFADPRYFAKPARSLFEEIRVHFTLAAQLRAYLIVKHNIDMAVRVIARMPERELDANGVPRSCQAMTRKGKPCQRPPLPRSDYCPSHQHLTESFEELEDLDRLGELEELELAA
jgi:hypothetical protein